MARKEISAKGKVGKSLPSKPAKGASPAVKTAPIQKKASAKR